MNHHHHHTQQQQKAGEQQLSEPEDMEMEGKKPSVEAILRLTTAINPNGVWLVRDIVNFAVNSKAKS